MPYITIVELEARSDARTVAELSNDSNSTARDDASVNAAISDASDLVDAKLRCRKAVPLSVVDAIIKRIVADLSLVGLAKRRGEISETLKERERGAIELLDSIAKGELQISAPDINVVKGFNLRPKIGHDHRKPFAGDGL